MAAWIQSEYSQTTVSSKRRLWTALLPALLMPLLASVIYFVLYPGTWFGKACFGLVKFHLVAWPVIGTVLIMRETLRRPSPSWAIRFRTLIPSALIGIVVVATMFGLMFTPLGEIVRSSGGRIRGKVDDLVMLDHYIALSIFICVVNSFIEEFYWRWFAYGNLRRVMPPIWAHGVAAIAFASHHIVVVSTFFPIGFALFIGCSVGVGGLIWSQIYQRYNTILGPWVCHIIIDAGFLWIAYDLFFRDL